MKAVCLLSGGLDSTLAVKIILNQGIDVFAINFTSIFCRCTKRGCQNIARKFAEEFGIKIKVVGLKDEYLEIIKHPKYGYGKNVNPCIDCRILMLKKAKEFMEEIGASFIVTGEVLNERPMSQRREAINIIERESGLVGLILRPLSAHLFPPTIPEIKGWIDREKLLAISGRSRKPQIKLAEELGIVDYPCPSGGCLLTDPAFARKMKDLLKYNPNFSLSDASLLKIGRHFRLSPSAKLIVGRCEEENMMLKKIAREDDVIFEPIDVKGPIALLRGRLEESLFSIAGSIVAKYCSSSNSKTKITFLGKVLLFEKIEEFQLERLRI